MGRCLTQSSYGRGGLLALFAIAACGSSEAGSICGSERPCVPEGTWLVTYEPTSSGQSFDSNTIRVDDDGGAQIVGETVSDNSCPPMQTGPGQLITSAALSNDGCTLTAEISKSWCQSGEANCEERQIQLDFCKSGSSTVAAGALEACVCWLNAGPSCGDTDFVTTPASASLITR